MNRRIVRPGIPDYVEQAIAKHLAGEKPDLLGPLDRIPVSYTDQFKLVTAGLYEDDSGPVPTFWRIEGEQLVREADLGLEAEVEAAVLEGG